MKLKKFIYKFSNLVLTIDDASKDWARSSRMRGAWNRWFLCLIAGGALNLVVTLTPLESSISGVADGAFWYRVVMAVWVAAAIILLLLLTASYSKYTLEGGRTIRLGNVGFLYVTGTVLFGMLYYLVYLTHPDFFTVDPGYVHWYASIGDVKAAWTTKLHFVVFSVLDSFGVSYPYVESNAVLIAALRYVEKFYTFCLVALLVAGYVNQHARANRDA